MAALTVQQKIEIARLYEEYPQEKKELYDRKPGIYGIYCDNNLVYVGKSTNLLNRWLIHKTHTLCNYATEYNRPMYRELRRAINLGHTIDIKALEVCDVNISKQELKEKEEKRIAATTPPLNTLIPRMDGSGRSYKKEVSPIC